MVNKKIISLEDETRAKLDQIAQDFNFLRRRIDSWKELRETDLMVYEQIKEFVYENNEMIDLMKRFLIREHGFNARKELVLKRDQKLVGFGPGLNRNND